ncbi:MAG: 3-phosphoshikimate 1-carboxyvinyltransferase, partial [Candidatus Delongbacteria bacterium]
MQDKIFIKKSHISGITRSYPSKSYIQRALILGLLNRNSTVIYNYGRSDDSEAVYRAVKKLGAKITRSGNVVGIKGPDGFITNTVFCNASGLCLRLFAPVLALMPSEKKILGTSGLLRRGNEYICDILAQLGVDCKLQNEFLYLKGCLTCGTVRMDGPSGSQIVSGLLFALSMIEGSSRIIIKNPVSLPYISMTADMLNRFGAEIRTESEGNIYIKGGCRFIQGSIHIEGDWSSAAFMLTAGAISGNVTVKGLNPDSLQPDSEILRYLKKAGAEVEINGTSVGVTRSALKAFTADIKHSPDLFIPLVILALNCEGESKINNIGRLKYKESDRPASILRELTKAGADIKIKKDQIVVRGSKLKYAVLDPCNDHRLAMGFSVAALNSSEGLSIKNFHCVNKSFPLFYKELMALKGARPLLLSRRGSQLAGGHHQRRRHRQDAPVDERDPHHGGP